VLVVDDALLFAVLSGTADLDLQSALNEDELFTTGSWCWRLSPALHDLTSEQQARVVASVARLPDEVGLLTLRELVPVMTALNPGVFSTSLPLRPSPPQSSSTPALSSPPTRPGSR
jgi:hypothetical protein